MIIGQCRPWFVHGLVQINPVWHGPVRCDLTYLSAKIKEKALSCIQVNIVSYGKATALDMVEEIIGSNS